MPEESRVVVARALKHAAEEGITIDDSFRSAMSSYSALLRHAGPHLRFRPGDIRFVDAVITAKALEAAGKMPRKVLDANLAFRTMAEIKVPPFDPDDPCTGAAREIVKRRGIILESSLGARVQTLTAD